MMKVPLDAPTINKLEISSRCGFPMMRESQKLKKTLQSHLEKNMDQGLFWGSLPLMNDQKIKYVAKTVRDYFK
jgi:hypothetical protein